MRRKKGSLPNGLTWRRCAACTLTTEGVTRCSIGASDGIGWPSSAIGRAATIGTACAVAGSAARAGDCTASRMAVAANPPNAAAAASTSRVGAGRMVGSRLGGGSGEDGREASPGQARLRSRRAALHHEGVRNSRFTPLHPA
jgi:hypothetical protein